MNISMNAMKLHCVKVLKEEICNLETINRLLNRVIQVKILLEIEDKKVPFILELLKHFKFVKAKALEDDDIKHSIKEAINEMNLVKKGKIKAIPAKDVLNEL